MADGRETLQAQTRKCSYCDKTARFMKLCTQCRAIIYCSRECQIKDWPIHKTKCSKVKLNKERKTSLQGPLLTQSEIMEEKEKVEGNHRNSSEDMNDGKHVQLEKKMGYSKDIDKKQELFLDKENTLTSSSTKELEEESTKEKCTSTTNMNLSRNTNDEPKRILQMNGDIVTIFIKHNKEKKKVELVKTPEDGNSAFQQISDFLRIPAAKLKLIHRGKMVIPANVNTFLTHGALFLAFGEVSKSEDGLDKTDIDILMKQLNVDRNVAVKALRQTGTLIDAIFDIGNKL